MTTRAALLAPAAIALAMATASCDYTRAPRACSAAMPPAESFLHDPAFEPLQYHKRTDYDVIRGLGYDLWADSRFTYRTGLEFTIVPDKEGANEDRVCTKAVALRIAMPLVPEDRRRLGAFVRIAGRGTGLDEKQLLAVLDERIAAGEKYRAIALQGGVTVEGGKVNHPSRGDFFVVAFSWPPG